MNRSKSEGVNEVTLTQVNFLIYNALPHTLLHLILPRPQRNRYSNHFCMEGKSSKKHLVQIHSTDEPRSSSSDLGTTVLAVCEATRAS